MAGIQDLHTYSFGRHGSTYMGDTATYTGKWFAVYVISEAVFNTITEDSNNVLIDGDSLVGETIAAGTTIYGNFTVLDLTSGSCIAFKDHTATAVVIS